MELDNYIKKKVISWIREVEKVEGNIISIYTIHSSCLSIKFESGKAYKLNFSLSSEATLS